MRLLGTEFEQHASHDAFPEQRLRYRSLASSAGAVDDDIHNNDYDDERSYEHYTPSTPSYFLTRYCDFDFADRVGPNYHRWSHFLALPESFFLLVCVGVLSLVLPEVIYKKFRRGLPLPEHPLLSFTARFLPSLTGFLHLIAAICGMVAMGNDHDHATTGGGYSKSAACDLMYGFASPLYIGVGIPIMFITAKISRSRRGLDLLCPRPSDEDGAEGDDGRRRRRREQRAGGRGRDGNNHNNNRGAPLGSSGNDDDDDSSSGQESNEEDRPDTGVRVLTPAKDSPSVAGRRPATVVVKNFDRTLRHWHSLGAQPTVWLSTPYLLLAVCACLPVFTVFLPAAALLVLSAAEWVGLVVAHSSSRSR